MNVCVAHFQMNLCVAKNFGAWTENVGALSQIWRIACLEVALAHGLKSLATPALEQRIKPIEGHIGFQVVFLLLMRARVHIPSSSLSPQKSTYTIVSILDFFLKNAISSTLQKQFCHGKKGGLFLFLLLFRQFCLFQILIRSDNVVLNVFL